MNCPYISAKEEADKNYYYRFSLCEYDGIPIVFVAVDDDNNPYICECTDTRFGEQNWTIADTTSSTIKELIQQKITLYEALRRGKLITVVKRDLSTGIFEHRIISFDQLNDEEKPEKDAFVWINNIYAEDDLKDMLKKGAHMPTLAELKEKVKEMEQAADRLLQVTKDLREAVSVPWIT